MTTDTDLYIGLMSGTSTDAVDAVLVEFASKGQLTIHASHCLVFDSSLKNSIIELNQPSDNEIDRMCRVEHQLTHCYAQAIQQLMDASQYQSQHIRAIGMHGQTIRHQPHNHYSLQIGNPALLAELTGIDVIANFRSRDIAAQGQGAPLAPIFHDWLWRDTKPTVVLNLGGIANLTLLPADRSAPVLGFDTGPANILLDAWIHQHQGKPYDDQGLWAASGTCDSQLLERLLRHSFFSQPLPKSTGRDDFNLAWLQEQLEGLTLASEDVQATLTELTASSISDQLIANGYHQCQLIICGGGCYNHRLISRIAALSPESNIHTSEQLGIAPNHVEASVFAWLAMRCLQGETSNLMTVTGARGQRVLGAHYQA